METLQVQFSGWLGYLDRWAVSWQIAFILCVVIATAFIRRYVQFTDKISIPAVLLGPLTLLGPGLLLWIAQIPSGIITQTGLCWALLSVLNWIESRLKIKNPKNQFAFWLGRIVRPMILISFIIYFIERLSSISAISLISLGNIFNTELLIGNIFLLAIGIYLILATSQTLAGIAAYLMQFALRTSDRNRKVLQPLFRYLIVTFGLVILAFWAGFDSSAFLVIYGTIGIGLGFGLKEPFLNLVTGIWLLLEGDIKPGEILMIENDACRVKSLGLRATTLRRQRDEAELFIPNQILFSTQAESFTAGSNDRRESIMVGTAYHHDPQHIIALLEQIAQSHKRILSKPMPQAFTVDFAESSINYKLKFSVRNPLEALSVGSELRQQIWTAFEENNITIPFPQRQLYPMEWPPKDGKTYRLAKDPSGTTTSQDAEAKSNRDEFSELEKPQSDYQT